MEFEPDTFGRLYADLYDGRHDPGTTEASVALISDLAGPDARILELAIGTGRMALPLAAKGHHIEGIDGSPDMVTQMRAKPGGEAIPVTIGDMADVGRDGPFEVAFLVFNTLFNLTSQEAQVRLFQNLGTRLKPGGRFLVETFIPDFSAFSDHQRMTTRQVEMEMLDFEAIHHDPISQTLRMQRVRMTPEGNTLSPLVLRYATPPEIDLMAQLGGLRLTDRWSDWDRSPFTADSKMHISVYEKPA